MQVYGNYLKKRRSGLCKETWSKNSVTPDSVILHKVKIDALTEVGEGISSHGNVDYTGEGT